MPGIHAICSASGASRWIACPPSARLAAKFGEQSSEYADEGTLAHTLSEILLSALLGFITEREALERVKVVKRDKFYNEEMHDHCEDYARFIVERLNRADRIHGADNVDVWVEEKLNLDHLAPESFGTSDAGIIGGDMLEIVDLKYGKGVEVSAVENSQLKMYALGALRRFDKKRKVRRVTRTIYQPRIGNIDSWECTSDDLEDWAEDVLIPAGQKAFHGKGRFRAGSHCRWCPAAGSCQANMEYNLELARFDFIDAALLTDKDVSWVLKRADDFTRWVNDVKEHALTQAVNHGKHYPGFKVVEGRSNRVFQSEETAMRILELEGYDPDDFTRRKLLTLEGLKKFLGSTTFAQVVEPLLIKPEGKLTLVTKDDRRPAWRSVDEARRVFRDHLD